jgi:hypothetical protein
VDDAGSTLAGVIASVAPGPDAIRVAVDVAPEDDSGRVVLLVSPETEIEVRRADGTGGRGGVADLVAGARIVARHTGAELRSLPPQYHATYVRVVPGP